MEPILQESAVSVINVHKSILPQIPPWIIKKPQVIVQLNKLHKTKTHPSTYLENFHTIFLHHPDHQCIFTDDSKDNNKTACATVLNKTIHKKVFPMKSSIFTAEVFAIGLALNIISRDKHNKFIRFSNSLSVLTSVKNKKLENPLIVKLHSRLDSMSSHKKIILCWIPRYIGVSGNERANSVAKSALDLSPEILSIPYTDLKLTISKFLHTKWQQRWDINMHNRLFQIQPTFGEWRPAFRKSRREQVVITRWRIGHTRLTHSFILKQEPPPQCLTCQTTCAVKHILIDCRAFAVIRKRFFKVTSLTELFENVKKDDVLSFLLEIGLYEKIWRIKTG